MINKLQEWVVVCSFVSVLSIFGAVGVELTLARAGRVSEGCEAAADTLLRMTRDPGPGEGAAGSGDEGPDILYKTKYFQLQNFDE